MKSKWIWMGFMACLCAIPALSQNLEVTGDYSYLRFQPTLGNFTTANLNGGGLDASFFFGQHFHGRFGIKADLQFYANDTFTTTFPTTVTQFGTIPAGTYKANGSAQTYLIGPIIKGHTKHFEPFGEVLFGIAHSDIFTSLSRSIRSAPGGSTFVFNGSQNPFAMAAGGGIDIPITHMFAIRAGEVDYILTRFQNPVTGNQNQNNFRVLGGIQIRLGGH